jgi:hypothetical protein
MIMSSEPCETRFDLGGGSARHDEGEAQTQRWENEGGARLGTRKIRSAERPFSLDAATRPGDGSASRSVVPEGRALSAASVSISPIRQTVKLGQCAAGMAAA